MKYTFCPICASELTNGIVDNRERLYCSNDDCDLVFWDNPVPVVAAIVERNNHVILARNKSWPDHIFGLITGFLEKDESPEESVLREVEEELGLSGQVEKFIGYYPFQMNNQLILAFHVSIPDGIIKLGDELAAVKEIHREKIKPWSFGTGLALKDWLEGKSREIISTKIDNGGL